MSDTIKVSIPKEILDLTGIDADSIDKKNLEILILGLYAEGKLTLSKAADILQIKIDVFLARFRSLHYKRTGSPIDVAEAERDLQEAMQN
ncbi:MAG: hypothetical protein GPJ54_06645 [Candidatus Heimdallarchaeota archaeon]|nr:hypothetical protein [Candidatus Heimdallarchaeota archaeon]